MEESKDTTVHLFSDIADIKTEIAHIRINIDTLSNRLSDLQNKLIKLALEIKTEISKK